jgi:hypothetical protein
LDYGTGLDWGLTGASSSEDSSSEDSYFLTGFLATTGAFLAGTSSELSSELSYFFTYF